ncbi:hypothetical protein D3C85_1518470 [compost metagenome]
MPGTRLMKNSQCHEKWSVIQPPTVGPSVGASEASAPTVAAAITRCGPLKNAKAVVNTIGIIEPPRKPCSARNAIMLWMSHAMPHSRLVTVKPAAEAANSQRVDITRESQPDSGMTIISAIR